MIISMDINSWAKRGVLLDEFGAVLSYFDSRSSRTAKLWLRKALEICPDAVIVGSPLDDWPPELLEEARLRNADLDWLNPTMLRALYTAGRSWTLQRKLHRARLLAYLHQHRVESWDLSGRLREFEHDLARETLLS